ncbi:hypothetical protein ISP15_13080 [Dyella jejuensis]|uniref:Secreted protein n=1 Tax=Dyella jejuensis TaxID=1432009 RepID=A0ABW8JJX8_9GAMM
MNRLTALTTLTTLSVSLLSMSVSPRAQAQNVIGPASADVYACITLGGVVTWQTTACPNDGLTVPAQAAGSTWTATIAADGTITSGKDWISSVTYNGGVYTAAFTSSFPQTPNCALTYIGTDSANTVPYPYVDTPITATGIEYGNISQRSLGTPAFIQGPVLISCSEAQ